MTSVQMQIMNRVAEPKKTYFKEKEEYRLRQENKYLLEELTKAREKIEKLENSRQTFDDLNDYEKAELIKEKTNHLTMVSYEEMESTLRKREFCEARYIAMDLMRKKTNMSLNKIGSYFGSRDHSTVINALKNVEDWFDTNERKFINLYEQVERSLSVWEVKKEDKND